MPANVELEKVYDPGQVEAEMYALWEAAGAFQADPDDRTAARRFVIWIPLPNVTGALHLGHAINNTLQDILIRWHRMKGDNTLWQPGVDHAGIATQAVVEKRIFEEEGLTRHDLGRDKLVDRIWQWKDQYQKRIVQQLQQMGCSCDWRRMRFTLDEVCANAVRHAFFRLFKDGLIYRGKRLVNWDTQLQTAVADDEVYHETVKATLTHIRYPVTGTDLHLVVATTRPETMLGDTAVAVHPDDDRYRHLIGKTCTLPLMDRPIPIIGDPILVKMEFGTGCVKVTPAHDPNDYDCGLRNNLDMINILTPDGRINENGGAYQGLDRYEASRKVVEDLQAQGLIEEIEDYEHDVGHSDRSKTPIEPYLSDQWFLKMGDVPGGVQLADGTRAPGLAQAAMNAVIDGRVKVFPSRYAKTYLDWLGEKRDWCISRQLWWGHRIPVWSYELSNAGKAALLKGHRGMPERDQRALDLFRELPEQRSDSVAGNALRQIPYEEGLSLEEREVMRTRQNVIIPVPAVLEAKVYLCLREDDSALIEELEAVGFKRDPDVLDTWFSSALWPFSTLGWPNEKTSKELGLEYYYPGSVLITSRDIITLWVARMVLTGLYCVGDIPFHHTYIHAKILDGRGEGMSKSKGNGVDPLDIIEVYGADALRYALADMTTEMQDVRMPVEYRCPHCHGLTPQTASNLHAKTLKCKPCGRTFATQWADNATQEQHGRALMVSDKFEIGRNFCNKLWNAARYAFMNLAGVGCDGIAIEQLPPEDRWILARLNRTAVESQQLLREYRYSASIRCLREFFWDSLCDWYIELVKPRLSGGHRAQEARQVLAFCLDQILRLLHPFVPFITERLWRQLNAIAPRRGLPPAAGVRAGPGAAMEGEGPPQGPSDLAELHVPDLLINAECPPSESRPALHDDAILHVFEEIQSITRGVRELRNTCKVSPKQPVTVSVKAPAEDIESLQNHVHIIRALANVENLLVAPDATRPPNSASALVGGLQIWVHDISDDQVERRRVEKELAQVDKLIQGKQSKLANENFVKNANPGVVQAERDRLADLQARRRRLEAALVELD